MEGHKIKKDPHFVPHMGKLGEYRSRDSLSINGIALKGKMEVSGGLIE